MDAKRESEIRQFQGNTFGGGAGDLLAELDRLRANEKRLTEELAHTRTVLTNLHFVADLVVPVVKVEFRDAASALYCAAVEAAGRDQLQVQATRLHPCGASLACAVRCLREAGRT